MRIRPLHPDEHALVAAVATRNEDHATIRTYLERLLDRGHTQPAWWFLLHDGAHALGRVAFWSLPGHPAPSDIVLLDVHGERDERDLGTRLLTETVQHMRDQGDADLAYVLDLPPRSNAGGVPRRFPS